MLHPRSYCYTFLSRAADDVSMLLMQIRPKTFLRLIQIQNAAPIGSYYCAIRIRSEHRAKSCRDNKVWVERAKEFHCTIQKLSFLFNIQLSIKRYGLNGETD